MHVLAQVKGVDGLDEADHADLKEIVHALAAARKLLHDREHEPQIARDELFARLAVAVSGAAQQRARLGGFQHRELRGVHAANLDLSLHKKAPPPKTRVELVFPAKGKMIRQEKGLPAATKMHGTEIFQKTTR